MEWRSEVAETVRLVKEAVADGVREGVTEWQLDQLPHRSTEITITLPVTDLLAARRALWATGQHEAAVRVLEAYAQARTVADKQAADLKDAF